MPCEFVVPRRHGRAVQRLHRRPRLPVRLERELGLRRRRAVRQLRRQFLLAKPGPVRQVLRVAGVRGGRDEPDVLQLPADRQCQQHGLRGGHYELQRRPLPFERRVPRLPDAAGLVRQLPVLLRRRLGLVFLLLGRLPERADGDADCLRRASERFDLSSRQVPLPDGRLELLRPVPERAGQRAVRQRLLHVSGRHADGAHVLLVRCRLHDLVRLHVRRQLHGWHELLVGLVELRRVHSGLHLCGRPGCRGVHELSRGQVPQRLELPELRHRLHVRRRNGGALVQLRRRLLPDVVRRLVRHMPLGLGLPLQPGVRLQLRRWHGGAHGLQLQRRLLSEPKQQLPVHAMPG